MPYKSRTELQPGMTLRRDLLDRHGRVLIRAGTRLEDKHLRALKLWGIPAVHIQEDEDTPSPDTEPSTFSPEALEAATEQATALFQHNLALRDLPVFKQLFAQCVSRLAQRIQEGTSPEMPQQQPDPAPARDPEDRWPLDKLIEETKTVASLPTIYNEIVRVVQHPRSSMDDVANVISSDVGLTARLLRIVNSAFYGFPAEIETVTRAVALVGTSDLCELALATSVVGMFDKALLGDAVDVGSFWRHSIHCGAVARHLANQLRTPDPGRYLVTGLLHDIGRMVMYVKMPELAHQALATASRDGIPLHLAEEQQIGFSHAEVGGALLSTWNLPAEQCRAVRDHHTPPQGDRRSIETAIVHVADLVANATLIGHSGNRVLPPLVLDAWDCLELDANVLPGIVDASEMQVSDLAAIFGV